MSGINLSSKHGVNPCIPVCFFCGEEKNEIALLGKLPGDKEAPHHAVIDYEPCDKCKENMSKGIALIGVTDINNNRPPITKNNNKNLYPTGNWLVLTEDGVKNIFTENMVCELIKTRKAFIDNLIIESIQNEYAKIADE